jgi:hypothetical protein
VAVTEIEPVTSACKSRYSQVLRTGELRPEAKSQKKGLQIMAFRGNRDVPMLLATSSRSFKEAFIPIYPNTLPTVPKPSRAGRMVSLVFRNLPASQSATTRENR